VRSAWETSAWNPSVSFCEGPLKFWAPSVRTIFRTLIFLSGLPFQTRLTHTKPVLPLSNQHGSQVKDQGRRQCCQYKHKNFTIGIHVMCLYFLDMPRKSLFIKFIVNLMSWICLWTSYAWYLFHFVLT
jgi:hypothetical protein